MNNIERCLTCTAEKCSGNYPKCQGGRNERKRTALNQLGKGNATLLICLLAKLGYKRSEIAKICATPNSTVGTLLKAGLRKGLVTEDIIETSRTYARKKVSMEEGA